MRRRSVAAKTRAGILLVSPHRRNLIATGRDDASVVRDAAAGQELGHLSETIDDGRLPALFPACVPSCIGR